MNYDTSNLLRSSVELWKLCEPSFTALVNSSRLQEAAWQNAECKVVSCRSNEVREGRWVMTLMSLVTPPQQIMWTVSCIRPSNLYILRSLNSSQLTLLRSVLFTICSERDKVDWDDIKWHINNNNIQNCAQSVLSNVISPVLWRTEVTPVPVSRVTCHVSHVSTVTKQWFVTSDVTLSQAALTSDTFVLPLTQHNSKSK